MDEKEYIEREAAIATACKGCNKEFPNEPCEPADCYIQQRLFKIPAADVVEVVRCKDCAHKVDFKGRVMCKRNAKKHGAEWYGLTATDNNHFCSHGERKGEGE